MSVVQRVLLFFRVTAVFVINESCKCAALAPTCTPRPGPPRQAGSPHCGGAQMARPKPPDMEVTALELQREVLTTEHELMLRRPGGGWVTSQPPPPELSHT